MEKGLKVINLSISNLMRVSAVDITPKGDIVIISGKNGQGKTSVLNAIAFALGGKKLIPKEPIKKGEKTAIVKVDLGEYVVTRKWTANDKSTVKVEAKDGAQYTSPQIMLDKLIGSLSFDPLAFANMCKDAAGRKRQKDMLLELVDIGIDIDAKREERQIVFDARTITNKNLSQEQIKLANIEEPDMSLVEREDIPISALVEEMNKANTVNADNKQSRDSLVHQQAYCGALKEELDNLFDERRTIERQIKDKAEEVSREDVRADNLKKTVSSLVDIDVSEISEKMNRLDSENRKIRNAKQLYGARQNAKFCIDTLISKTRKQTKTIDGIDVDVKTALQSAKFPIDGLSVNADGVTFNNIPFNQASGAEQLKISMAIAMALNPKLRVIRITDGSLLDADNMKVLGEMAKENDFQVWVERVDSSGKVGISIEDGKIVNMAC